VRPTPTPGAERLPRGRDLDEALYCVDRYYTGPDGLPLAAMLDAALSALTHAHPSLRRAVEADGAFTLSPPPGSAAAPLAIDRVSDAQSLTAALLHIAEFARANLGSDDSGAPEEVLLDGALSALAWETRLLRPPWTPPGYIPPESFTAVSRDNLVYIKVGQLVGGVAARLRRELTWHGIGGIVLDLRASEGGLLSDALGIADVFLRDGCLGTARPHPEAGAAVAHNEGDDVDKQPLVILVDHLTAEGAELIAATLRARHRAIILGTHTFGRALLHTVVRLSGGSMLKLAVGELLAADGTPFHQLGIEPDLSVPPSFAPNSSTDRELELAKMILRRTRGAAPADLLDAARAILPAPAAADGATR
jgi:hypothetical protein